jgi:hypothetical protein
MEYIKDCKEVRRQQERAPHSPPGGRKMGWLGKAGCGLLPHASILLLFSSGTSYVIREGSMASQHSQGSICGSFCLHPCSPLPFVLSASCPCPGALSWRALTLASLGADPVSRKNVKSAHSTRNRYSSQWTLTKCQASTPAHTLTSDWRTVGSQHGVTVTESDSYSASLSQDTGVPRAMPASCPPSSKFPIFPLLPTIS